MNNQPSPAVEADNPEYLDHLGQCRYWLDALGHMITLTDDESEEADKASAAYFLEVSGDDFDPFSHLGDSVLEFSRDHRLTGTDMAATRDNLTGARLVVGTGGPHTELQRAEDGNWVVASWGWYLKHRAELPIDGGRAAILEDFVDSFFECC